jgi:polar amino acid transport system substrate-binding protein
MTMVRKLPLYTFATLLALSVTHQANADALERVMADKTLIVAIDPTFPPFEYTDETGKIIGYDPSIIEAVAAKMGVEVKYEVMAFSGIIPGLIAGAFDVTPTLNVTAERAGKIDYTMPTAASMNAVLIVEGNGVASSAIDDLSGKTCAVKQTTQPEQMMMTMNEELVAAGKPPVELLGFETIEQTVAALVDGRASCVVDDKTVLLQAVTARPDDKLMVVGDIGGTQWIAWGVNKANPELTAALSKAIAELQADGTIAALQQTAFGFALTLPEADFIPAE